MTAQEARDRITADMGWSTYLPEGTNRMSETTATSSTVVGRWADVMSELQGLAKGERVQTGSTRFNFRGIDAVMNALGPVLRKHRVIIVPMVENHWREEYASKGGGRMVGTIVQVAYTIRAADTGEEVIVGSAFGEASDSGDKSMPKAMSVAYRTFLLQALTLPTDEPDPDTFIHERAEPTAAPPPVGPPIESDTVDAIQDLFESMNLTPDQQMAGIAARAGRSVPLSDLTESEGQRVLLALQRKMQATSAAPTPEEAEARVQRALGGTPIEEGQ